MKKIHSIHSKIIMLAIIPMLFIALLLLSYAFFGGMTNVTSALNNSLSETAKISAQAITNQLVIYETAVNEAASNQLFQNENTDSEKIMDFLEEVKERNGFSRIGYTDVNGVNQNGSDFSERQYFKDCRESMAPVTSDPYSSKDGNGALSVLFCAPIIRSGSFCGIVYGAADAKLFTDIISNVVVGEDGMNFIIDSTGTFIAHNDFSLASGLVNYISETEADPSLSEQAAVISEMLTNQTGSLIYNDSSPRHHISLCGIGGCFFAPCRELYALLSQSVTGGFAAELVVAAPQLTNAIVLMTLPTALQGAVSTATSGYIISTGALRGAGVPPAPPLR